MRCDIVSYLSVSDKSETPSLMQQGREFLSENGMIKQELRTQQLARQLARKLRNNLTEAEKILWAKLRNKQLMGYKFLSQHPVFYKDNGYLKFFIADFYCHQLKLVIEVDGNIHENQKEYDNVRTKFLASKKIKVIRFQNSEVLENINRILIYIKKCL